MGSQPSLPALHVLDDVPASLADWQKALLTDLHDLFAASRIAMPHVLLTLIVEYVHRPSFEQLMRVAGRPVTWFSTGVLNRIPASVSGHRSSDLIGVKYRDMFRWQLRASTGMKSWRLPVAALRNWDVHGRDSSTKQRWFNHKLLWPTAANNFLTKFTEMVGHRFPNLMQSDERERVVAVMKSFLSLVAACDDWNEPVAWDQFAPVRSYRLSISSAGFVRQRFGATTTTGVSGWCTSYPSPYRSRISRAIRIRPFPRTRSNSYSKPLLRRPDSVPNCTARTYVQWKSIS